MESDPRNERIEKSDTVLAAIKRANYFTEILSTVALEVLFEVPFDGCGRVLKTAIE